jgi:hemolysin activation/secretion protein
LRYFQRRGSHTLFFLSLAAAATDFSDGTQFLSLGGEIGARGYPTNYQRGDRRVTFAAERRFYSDWFLLRLIRVGGAVFFDAGRAWGGPYQKSDEAAEHWASDIGFGLRLLSARSASGTTVHVDLAFPLKRAPGVDAFQLSVQSRTGF